MEPEEGGRQVYQREVVRQRGGLRVVWRRNGLRGYREDAERPGANGVPRQYETAGGVQAGYPVRQRTSRRHPLAGPAEGDGEVAEGHHPVEGQPPAEGQVRADAGGATYLTRQ